MEILLVRHGETDWNRARRMQGHIDIPLNVEGLRQARALGAALASEKLDVIYASDLQRARVTAQAVADVHQMPVVIDEQLRERCYGVFEGLMYKEVAQQFPQEFALWQARDLHARFPAGEREAETLHNFHQRSVNAVTNIVKNHPAQRMLILTHGGVLDCLYREATGMPVDAKREFGIINAAINRLQWDGKKFTILQWADAAHLERDGLDEIDRTHPAA